jgi:type VI secretion system protein ImpA
MISAEELLKPISEANPCGEDLYYDPKFQELDTLILGKPENQFSNAPAEDPDWRKLHERCLELSTRSKDLRVATKLCLTALKIDGLPAVAEGLALLKGLLETYWEPVYPKLDPDDNNDPLYRVNIIAALSTARGTFGDPMRFLERLREVPLAESSKVGRFSLADVARSKPGKASENAESAALAAQIKGAFLDMKPDHLLALNQVVAESCKHVDAIDAFLTSTVGEDKAPNLDLLKAELKEIQKSLIDYLPAGTVGLAPEAPTANGAPAADSATKPISGEIQSRRDAILMLDKICQYYSRTEPASPVPNLLRRAKRVAEMDFMEIIKELCPDAEGTVRTVTGEKVEGAS